MRNGDNICLVGLLQIGESVLCKVASGASGDWMMVMMVPVEQQGLKEHRR